MCDFFYFTNTNVHVTVTGEKKSKLSLKDVYYNWNGSIYLVELTQ